MLVHFEHQSSTIDSSRLCEFETLIGMPSCTIIMYEDRYVKQIPREEEVAGEVPLMTRSPVLDTSVPFAFSHPSHIS